MKKLKRLLCLLLVAVSLMTLIPGTAMAATDKKKSKKEETTYVTVKKKVPSQAVTKFVVEVGKKPVDLEVDQYVTIKNNVYEFSHFAIGKEQYWYLTIPAYDGTKAWETKWGNTISVVYKRHYHNYEKGFNRIYHWDMCECGKVGEKEHHVDPATDSDKICICDYHFSDNANLTTLWLQDVVPSVVFNPEITDYTGEVRTYLDVTATKITARSFDALATIELPTDLTIKEGLNTFQIKVTAEDKTTTKTYTFKAVKPVKVEDATIAADGESLAVTPKTVVTKELNGTVVLSEAVEKKLTEMLTSQQAKRVTFLPTFSKWSIKAAEVTLNGALLDAIAKKPADLAITTPYGTTLTIPAAQLPALAAKETVTIRVAKDNTFAVVSGEEILTLPETIALEIPTPAA